ncbi:glycoside hydrolase family 25 protein [Eubacterium sp.]|uniref:glycoside hydrolase family 25 protein n=1 Tax=Eubacterium sp. TaxID=142586 RepID=UPI0039923E8C
MKSEAKKKVAVFLVAALIATTVPFNFTSVKAQAKTNQNNKYSVRVNAEEEPVTVDGSQQETTKESQETTEPSKETSTIETSTTETSTVQESSTTDITTTQPPTVETTTQAPTTQAPTTQAPTTEAPTTSKKTAWGESNGKFYNDKLKQITGAVAKGLDVSHHQGKIDWEKVSKSDIDFVIIRCGYGNNIASQDDKYFAQNVAGCEKYNIPYGIYIYSYALNVSDAKSEAKHVLRLIKSTGAKPTYPIYIDYEDSSQNGLTPKQLGNFATAFFNKTIAAGYKAGVYANLNWWTNKLTDSRFNQWTKWVAQYNSACSYTKPYQIWQSTSTGKVSGVNGNADLNFLMQFDCIEDGHIYSQWVTTKSATIFAKGTKVRICSVCGKLQTKETKKLKPTGKLNTTKVTLRFRRKYNRIRVSNLSAGDKVKSYKSSNKKIATVNKKGVIKAKKKKGKATITVNLKSGKKLKVKVTVRRK